MSTTASPFGCAWPLRLALRVALIAVLLVALPACWFDEEIPGGSKAQITCAPDGDDCPTGFVCAQTDGGGLCVAVDAAACGNGRLDDGEQCDDQNLLRGDGCGVSCRDEECGNGVVDPGEACDDDNVRSGDGCRADCAKEEVCGDGELDDGEQCDDGNAVDEDACLTSCVTNVCGDGVRNPEDEECDGPAPGCLTGCVANVCGDGVRDPEQEECDDGNAVASDACLPTCVNNVCGDGIRNPLSEACDDGNTTDADACLSDCVANVCGDGFVNPLAEACDGPAPGCLPGCVANVCGDSIVDPATEECDDGNDIAGDACLPGCVANVCGDGVRNPLSETCDDGNGDEGDACLSDCTSNVCGDGFVFSGVEICDDGNTDSFDGCRGDCGKLEACGDGVVDGDVALGLGEACDDANTNPADACDACRSVTWSVPSVANGDVNALGPGSGDPALTRLGTVHRTATAPDGSIVFGTRLQILRLTPSGVLVVVAGDGNSNPLAPVQEGDPAASASLYPYGTTRAVAVDAFGRVYFSDGSYPAVVYRVDDAGFLERVAGGGGDTGPNVSARSALLLEVGDMTVDVRGRLLLTEPLEDRVRRLEADGTLSTIAGTGVPGFSGDFDFATDAQLSGPSGIATDAIERVFIVDTGNQRVRVIDDDGIIRPFAGNGLVSGDGDGGLAVNAPLRSPRGVDVRPTGEVLIMETYPRRVREVDQAGIITTVAGTSALTGTDGVDAEGAATSIFLPELSDVAAGLDGRTVLGAGSGGRIRGVDAAGNLSTLVGTDTIALADRGASHLLGDAAGLAGDAEGRVLIADGNGCRVIALALDGTLSVVAGTGVCGYSGDSGPAVAAQLSQVRGLTVDAIGGIYVADTGNHVIRYIEPTGVIMTFAGTGTAGYSGDGLSALEAQFQSPDDVVLHPDGSVILSDTGNHVVRRIESGSGIVSTIAGNGVAAHSGDGDLATNASLNRPCGLAVDADENLYIADSENYIVRVVDPSGIINILPGSEFTAPYEIAVEGGLVYLADPMGPRIVAVDAEGYTSTVAGGTWGPPLYGNGGWPYDASLYSPRDVTFDREGRLLIADQNYNRVHRIDHDGLIYALVGDIEPASGAMLGAELSNPHQIVMVGPTLIATSRAGRIARVDWSARELSFIAGIEPGFPLGADPVVGNPSRARFTDLLGDLSGIATDGVSTLWVSARDTGAILRITFSDLSDHHTTLVESWVTGFDSPAALAFDGTRLYVADEGEHAIYAVDVDTQAVSLFHGVPGVAGSFQGRLNGPSALVTGTDGALFVADTGNHRVLRVDAPGVASVVIGTGEAASSGDGAPALSFPVHAPAGLAVDASGNLLISSTRTVRLVTADATGRVDGNGSVYTLYGRAESRGEWPMDTTVCLSGIAERAPGVIDVVDECLGYLLTIRRERSE